MRQITNRSRGTPHTPILRQYLVAVIKDMIARGSIRAATGWKLSDVLRVELFTIIPVVLEDLEAVGLEIGTDLTSSGIHAILGFLNNLTNKTRR